MKLEKGTKETASGADYAQLKSHAAAIEDILNEATRAEIGFSTGDTLYLNLMPCTAESESGDCSKTGQFTIFQAL